MCTSCRVAYGPRAMVGHLQQSLAHAGHRMPIHAAAYEDAVRVCGIPEHLPPVPTSVGVPLAGLPCFDGFACELCIGASSTVKGLGRHYARVHGGVPPPSVPTSCSFQRYHDGGDHLTRARFRVDVSADPTAVHHSLIDQAIDDIARTLDAALAAPVPSDDFRAYHPFLLRLGWYETVKGKDARTLHDSVLPSDPLSVPRRPEFPGLHELCLVWLNSIETLEKHLDHNVLKRLNSNKEHDLYVSVLRLDCYLLTQRLGMTNRSKRSYWMRARWPTPQPSRVF